MQSSSLAGWSSPQNQYSCLAQVHVLFCFGFGMLVSSIRSYYLVGCPRFCHSLPCSWLWYHLGQRQPRQIHPRGLPQIFLQPIWVIPTMCSQFIRYINHGLEKVERRRVEVKPKQKKKHNAHTSTHRSAKQPGSSISLYPGQGPQRP